MSRSLHFQKPTSPELRALIAILESAPHPLILQRAEAILWLCMVGIASEVAEIMNLHLSTILRYVRAFNRRRLHWITERHHGGPPRRISKRLERRIVSIAQHEPADYGLHYGTWSLSRLHWFITKKRKLVRRLSREHLRRLLKKMRCTSDGSSARSTVMIRAAPRF
jgi:transposase